MNLISIIDEKTINATKSGDEFNLMLKSNGRRISKIFRVKVVKEIKILRCNGCSVELKEKAYRLDDELYCEDCYKRRV